MRLKLFYSGLLMKEARIERENSMQRSTAALGKDVEIAGPEIGLEASPERVREMTVVFDIYCLAKDNSCA